MSLSEDFVAPVLPAGEFAGRQAFAKLIRQVCAMADQYAWREMIWADSSFADWPLGEREVIESLQTWSRQGRTLTLIAKRFDTLISTHHRFVTWRKQYSHIVQAFAAPSVSDDDFLSAIWTPTWALHRTSPTWSKGISGNEPARRLLLHESLRELRSKSTPAFAASTLGL